MPRASRTSAAFAALLLAGCGIREAAPPVRANDARFGRLDGRGEPPSKDELCGSWATNAVLRDDFAWTHTSFPETDRDASCFTPVHHDRRTVHVGPAPRGCGYPDARARVALEALATELDALAGGAKTTARAARLFDCGLSPAQRLASIRHDARVLRAVARDPATYPYAAITINGHGLAAQVDTKVAGFLPGETCRAPAEADYRPLGAMPFRAARAADSLRGGVAPFIITSGGAVHSAVVEAFALDDLLECDEGIAPDRVLVEPCADHTHTNLRNSARWIDAIGGRAAYLVTDDFIQSDYLQDFSGFELIFGSIDQRSLRDWGYVIGSWRQASTGSTKAGFWFSPYRFWAEPRDGLGSITCVDR